MEKSTPLAQMQYSSSLFPFSSSLQSEREGEPWKLVIRLQLSFKQSSKMTKNEHRKKRGIRHFPPR